MAREPKSLILCFDGTTNEYSANNTNVIKLYSILDKSHPSKQVCYYQPGLGQYFDSSVSPLFVKAAQGLDWGFAWYLYQHVIDGYKFIVQNWNEGDHIYIFGFSRGSYTARCVAGMVQKIGLLAKDNDQTLAFAYGLYERTDTEGIALASSYKRAFARDVKIDFVGVFDTVASVGMIVSRELPFTSLNPGIKVFRHALALDEHRFRFTYSGWSGPIPFPRKGLFPATPAIRIPASVSAWFQGVVWHLSHPVELYYKWEGSLDRVRAGSPDVKRILTAGVPLSLTAAASPVVKELLSSGVPMTAAHKILEDDKCEKIAPVSEVHTGSKTDVKEVWFTGCHSDIGGCAVADNVTRSLGDITLRWMVKQLIQLEAPVFWVPNALQNLFGPELGPDGQLKTAGTSADKQDSLDAHDCSAPIHDDLKYPIWWGFELLPLSWTWQDKEGNWYRQWRVNLARGRTIVGTPTLHSSVRQRMANPKLAYKPRANIMGPPNWAS